jgi:hypothetical protein
MVRAGSSRVFAAAAGRTKKAGGSLRTMLDLEDKFSRE